MTLLKLIVTDETNMIFYFFFGLCTGIGASLVVWLSDKYLRYLLKQSLPDKEEMDKAIREAQKEMTSYINP